VSEPLYDLNTRTWTETCPCIQAEQNDPDYPFHGRIEFRTNVACALCARPIDFDGETWRHFGGVLYCPGGEPYGEVATPPASTTGSEQP